MNRRAFLGVAAAAGARAAPARTTMGVTPDCFSAHNLRGALELVEFCASAGAGGCQARLASLEADYARKVRKRVEERGLYLEVQCALPAGDTAGFARTVAMAREAGATSLRTTAGARRYEQFSSLAQRAAWVAASKKRIEAALRIAQKHRMPLGLENHKDWTLDEQVALLKGYANEWLGACVDTGNGMALLDDPMEIVEGLAPFAVNCHFKDMAAEEYERGFLLAEVPPGEGMLDLKRILATLRRGNPRIRFSLEMITRDPLQVPCLDGKYWATFPDRNGVYLARTLALVRANKPRQPLPRITGLGPEARKRLEMEHVRRSMDFARTELGLI